MSLSEAVRAAYELENIRSRTATIGFITAGRIGGTVAKLAVDAGCRVVLSNSGGPETLAGLVEQLGLRAGAATASEAGKVGDVVVVTILFKQYTQVPVEPLGGKPVIDTTTIRRIATDTSPSSTMKGPPARNSCRLTDEELSTLTSALQKVALDCTFG